RERILKHELPPTSFWCFDEIHKYRLWRNFLKGLYDLKLPERKILVTGSARLDYYRFSGDSLQGRYYYLRLHPLSVAELQLKNQSELLELLQLGGFPEPYFSGEAVEAKRWSREYRTRLIREDLVQLERVHDIDHIELLALRLPELIGSPLSINALREDLQVSHKAVSTWLKILERLYAIFRLSPFGNVKIRSVKKEQKHYHFDWTLVPELPERFENLVACALLKWVHFQQDTKGEDLDLAYFRDVDAREVDFVVTSNRKPIIFVECKWDDSDISPALKYLKRRFPEAEASQISAVGKKDYVDGEGIRICPAIRFLENLV
ncbi:MAG: ATP-binding protein, partial [Gammaproteobacteria bacterium]